MALLAPTFAAGSWDTEYSLSVRNVYDQLIHPHKLAMPTLRILWANMDVEELGPDEKWHYPVITHDYSPGVATKNYRFNYEDLDNVIMQEWQPVKMANAASTNDVDWEHYKTPYARMNHIDLKVDSMHRGTTNVLNYLLFYDWVASTVVANRIDINSQLSSLQRPPEKLYMNDIVSVTQLPYSLPMLTRQAVTGYTLGNIALTTTQNQYWDVVNTDGDAAAVTRSGSGDNVDVVTAVDATLSKELDLDDVFAHLDKITEGWQYEWLAACPAALYRQLRNLIIAQNLRSPDSPIAELGLRDTCTIEASEYNVTFYLEPMMTALWPNSIFFWSTDAVFLKVDSAFAPKIYPWEKIPGTNMHGTGLYLNHQLCRPEASGVSAMHGFKASA